MEHEIVDEPEMDTVEKLEADTILSPDNNATQNDVNNTQTNETAEVDKNTNDKKGAATKDTKEKKSSRGRHPCISCARTFTNKRDLMTHQYMHRENPVFLCATCNKNFTTEASYRRHAQSHKPATNATRRQYMCSQCNAVFDTMKLLSAHHSDKHVDEKRFVCGICGSQFAWPENLRAHHRTHEVNPHECSACGRRFVDATSLRVHTRNAHGPNSEPSTPRKVFTCELCGRAYQFDFSLRAHMKGHEQSPITGHHFQAASKPTAVGCGTPQTLTITGPGGSVNGQTSDARYVEIDRDGIIDINAAVVGRDNRTGEIIVEVFNFNNDEVAAKQTQVADVKAGRISAAVMSTPSPATVRKSSRTSVAAAAVTTARSTAVAVDTSHGGELELTCTTDDADVGTVESADPTEDDIAGPADPSTPANNADSVAEGLEDVTDDVKHVDDFKTKVEDPITSESVALDDNKPDDAALNADSATSGKFVWYAPPQEASMANVELEPPAVLKGQPVEQADGQEDSSGLQPSETSAELSATFSNSVQNNSTDEQKIANTTLELHVLTAEQHDADGRSHEQVEQEQEQTEEQQIGSHGDNDDNDSAENEMSQCDGDVVVQEASELLRRLHKTPQTQQSTTSWSAAANVSTVRTAQTYKAESVRPVPVLAYSSAGPRTRARRHTPRSREPFMFNCIMTNEKPFCCQLCGETFRWEISLDIHHKVHLDGKIPNQKRRKSRHIPPTPAGRSTAVRGDEAVRGGVMTRSRGDGTKRLVTGAVKSPPPVGPSRIVPRCASSDDEEINDGDTFSFLVTSEEQADQEASPTPGAKSYRRLIPAAAASKHEMEIPDKTVKQTVKAGILKKCHTAQSQSDVNGSNNSRSTGLSRKLAAKGSSYVEKGLTAASNVSSQLVYVTVETIGTEDAVPSGSSAITIGQEIIDLDDLVGDTATTHPVSVSLPAATCAVPASVDLLPSSSVVSQPQVHMRSSTHTNAVNMRWCKHWVSCRRAAIVCYKCQRVVTTLAAVRLHSRRHSLTDTCRETLACTSCPACFTSRADLLLHRRVCHTSSHHPCRRCLRAFSSVSKLRKHRRRIHESLVSASVCQHCGKRFFTSAQFSVHEMSHTTSTAN